MVPRNDPLAVEVGIIGGLQHVGVHVLPSRLKVDHRHGAVAEIEAGAEHGIGDIQHTAEEAHAEALVGKEGYAVAVERLTHHLVAGVFPIVAEAEGQEKLVHRGVHALHPRLKVKPGQIGMLVPTLTQGTHLGGGEDLQILGVKERPRVLILGMRDGELVPDNPLVRPVANGDLLVEQIANGLRRLHGAEGGGGEDAVNAKEAETLGKSLGLLTPQRGQGVVGYSQRLTVANVIEKHGRISLVLDCM